MSVLNIKDPEAYRLAHELARSTGKSLTRVVVDALRAETVRTVKKPVDWARVREIKDRVAAKLNPKDGRSPDEIIGYDERGLPR